MSCEYTGKGKCVDQGCQKEGQVCLLLGSLLLLIETSKSMSIPPSQIQEQVKCWAGTFGLSKEAEGEHGQWQRVKKKTRRLRNIIPYSTHIMQPGPWIPGKGRHWVKVVFLSIHGMQCGSGRNGLVPQCSGWFGDSKALAIAITVSVGRLQACGPNWGVFTNKRHAYVLRAQHIAHRHTLLS